MSVRFAWDDAKRVSNLRAHGLDFVDAAEVFDGLAVTCEDSRFDYGEARFVTLGILRGVVVSIVHTETSRSIRIISFRKATRREQAFYFAQVQD